MAPDAGKISDASAAPKDATPDVGNFDFGALNETLANDAIPRPGEGLEQANGGQVKDMPSQGEGVMDSIMGENGITGAITDAADSVPKFQTEVMGGEKNLADFKITPEGQKELYGDGDGDGDKQQDQWNEKTAFGSGAMGKVLADIGNRNPEAAAKVDEAFDAIGSENFKGLNNMDLNKNDNPHSIEDANSWNVRQNNGGMG